MKWIMMFIVLLILAVTIDAVAADYTTEPCLSGVPSVHHNGLWWAWASPCSGAPYCYTPTPYNFVNGSSSNEWRYADNVEFALRPDPSAFGYPGGVDNNLVGLCAAPYFDSVHNYCQYMDAAAGRVTSYPNYNNTSITNRGYWESWFVHDECEVLPVNHPPTIIVSLSNDLNCSTIASDPDNDPLIVTIEWYLNGVLDYTVIAVSDVHPDVPGEYYCMARAFDGQEYSDWMTSDVVTVLPPNNPPTIAVSLSNDLNCSVVVNDLDNDPLIITYKWYLDGALADTVSTSNTVVTRSKVDGAHYCTALAYDGEDYSLLATSNVVNIVSPIIINYTDASIWTTRSDCGAVKKNVNGYAVGEIVYIHGEEFVSGYYAWNIKGQPGKASCDPNTIIASGQVHVVDGAFCIPAYTIDSGDCGVYSAAVANARDNYHIVK